MIDLLIGVGKGALIGCQHSQAMCEIRKSTTLMTNLANTVDVYSKSTLITLIYFLLLLINRPIRTNNCYSLDLCLIAK